MTPRTVGLLAGGAIVDLLAVAGQGKHGQARHYRDIAQRRIDEHHREQQRKGAK